MINLRLYFVDINVAIDDLRDWRTQQKQELEKKLKQNKIDEIKSEPTQKSYLDQDQSEEDEEEEYRKKEE